jgi:hypothetical protein
MVYTPAPPPPARPARAPRPMLADLAPEAPLPPPPPQEPTPVAMPHPALAPMPPMPPMPPMEIDQDRLLEMKERAWEAQEKAWEMKEHMLEMQHDLKFKFDIDHQVAMANDAVMNLKLNMPFAFAPQTPARIRSMSDDGAYSSGTRALEGRRYTEALEYFNQIAARGGNRADGALYWKAYSLIRLGRADEARAALVELRKAHPQSRWLDDAKALEVEAGKPVTPESESDEELKLIALNGLMQSDPDRAFPLLESLLKSAQPPRIKRNAVYVLAQSNSPKAQALLEQVAKGQGNPDLQLSAIRYLGEKRRQGNSNPVLQEIYKSSNDANVKRAVLSAYEAGRDKDRLLEIARTEKDPDLRLHAIRMLGSNQAAQQELWQLYQAETSPEVKQRILESIPSTGNIDKLLEIAKTEKDPKLRRYALNNLGNTRAATTGDALVQVYTAEQDQDVKRTIISVLASQKNVKQLIQCARSEKDARMQQRILEHLVNMKTPEASDYLMEIIKK